MANRYAAYSQPVPGGFRAMMRFSRDSHPKPIKRKDGSPEVYPTKGEASDAIIAQLLSFMNGNCIRGEMFESGEYTKRALAKMQADKLFKEAAE